MTSQGRLTLSKIQNDADIIQESDAAQNERMDALEDNVDG